MLKVPNAARTRRNICRQTLNMRECLITYANIVKRVENTTFKYNALQNFLLPDLEVFGRNVIRCPNALITVLV